MGLKEWHWGHLQSHDVPAEFNETHQVVQKLLAVDTHRRKHGQTDVRMNRQTMIS
jgi:hypothetical protein